MVYKVVAPFYLDAHAQKKSSHRGITHTTQQKRSKESEMNTCELTVHARGDILRVNSATTAKFDEWRIDSNSSRQIPTPNP